MENTNEVPRGYDRHRRSRSRGRRYHQANTQPYGLQSPRHSHRVLRRLNVDQSLDTWKYADARFGERLSPEELRSVQRHLPDSVVSECSRVTGSIIRLIALIIDGEEYPSDYASRVSERVRIGASVILNILSTSTTSAAQGPSDPVRQAVTLGDRMSGATTTGRRLAQPTSSYDRVWTMGERRTGAATRPTTTQPTTAFEEASTAMAALNISSPTQPAEDPKTPTFYDGWTQGDLVRKLMVQSVELNGANLTEKKLREEVESLHIHSQEQAKDLDDLDFATVMKIKGLTEENDDLRTAVTELRMKAEVLNIEIDVLQQRYDQPGVVATHELSSIDGHSAATSAETLNDQNIIIGLLSRIRQLEEQNSRMLQRLS